MRSTLLFAAAFKYGLALTIPTLVENHAIPVLENRIAIWQPNAGDTWQIVLSHPIDSSAIDATASRASIFDIDLFGNSETTISNLHSLNKKVICYFSAGSYEPYRPDSGDFKSSDQGSELDGWPDERWLDIRSANVRNIMVKRLQLAAEKGCDGVDPDNVDGYQNENGLGLEKEDAIDFIDFLAAHAASLNLAIGLKNAGELINSVLPNIQFAVNEQCSQYSECALWSPFIASNKPVFHIEYPSTAPNVPAASLSQWCGAKSTGSMAGFSTLLKMLDLGGDVQLCDGSTYITPIISSN